MPEDNPLTVRLIGRSAQLPVIFMVILGCVLGSAVGNALSLLPDPSDNKTVRDLVEWASVLIIGLHLLTPLIVSLVAAMLTARDVQSEDFQLLCATLLPNEKFVSGYIAATLYRTRFLLFALALAGTMRIVGFGVLEYEVHEVEFGLLEIPFVISVWGFVWLGVAIGVGTALKNDKFWLPVLTTPLIMLFSGALFLTSMLFLLALSLWLCYLLPVAMFAPFLIAKIIQDRASRWVRRT